VSIDILELASEALYLPDSIDAAAAHMGACGMRRHAATEALYRREAELLVSGTVNGSSEDRRKAQLRLETLEERAAWAAAAEAECAAIREYERLVRRHEALLVWAPILHAQKESR